jgi:hypothetical protein
MLAVPNGAVSQQTNRTFVVSRRLADPGDTAPTNKAASARVVTVLHVTNRISRPLPSMQRVVLPPRTEGLATRLVGHHSTTQNVQTVDGRIVEMRCGTNGMFMTRGDGGFSNRTAPIRITPTNIREGAKK